MSDTARSGQPLVSTQDLPAAVAQLRDAYVRQGFAELERHERLDPAAARQLYQAELDTAAAHVAASVPLLTQAPGIRDNEFAVITSGANQVRLARALDFAVPGDRILEVGVGFGYMTCLLLRDAAPRSYVGVDLTDARLDAVRQMIAANGLVDRQVRLEVMDLYDMTPEWMGRHDPDLIYLLEVLEHVPDAERALATLAASVREDAAILFSVPVYGRIEQCWGHVSIFDSARIRGMCADAGLVIHHVEVVHDTWAFVLATRSAMVPQRVLGLPVGPAADRQSDLVSGQFVGVPPRSMLPRGSAEVEVRGGTKLTVGSPAARIRGQVGGLAFPISGDLRLRLELSFDQPYRIRRVRVNTRSEGGTIANAWTWDCRVRPPRRGRRTYVLRPGRRSGPFKPAASSGDVGMRATTAEVIVETRGRTTLTVHRAAACAPD